MTGRLKPKQNRDDQKVGGASIAANFWAVFDSAPDAYLLLAPDPPRFSIVAANKACLRVTMTQSADILGRPLFEVFPDNPADPAATGVRNLQASLNDVIRSEKPHRIAAHKYHIRKPDGQFAEKYWHAVNTPVFDERGDLIYILLRVEDVTEEVLNARDLTESKRGEERLRESEERFRSLAENATVAIFVIDDASRIVFANPAVERIFGYSLAEMVGQSLKMLMPMDQRPRHDAGIHRYLDTGRRKIPWEGVELPGLTKDGRVVPLEISMGEFVRDGRHYFTGIARDITERKQAEAAVRESEERFRTLGNSIPQLAWMADPNGSIFWYNDRWHEYTGTTLEEMHDWGWQKVHHPEHIDRVIKRFRRAFETGEPWEDTFPIRSKSGEYRWFLSRALPIRDDAGKVVRWFGTNTDITAEIEAAAERERILEREREAREEAERQREELEIVSESRTRLMRGFTHDVKNPLGAADGYAQLLEDGVLGELTAKQVESVQRIRRSLHTSLHLINELMELAQAESGQIELEPVAVDVADLVKEAVEDFRAQARAAGLDLEVRAHQALPTHIDPTRVRQILSNLLSNAVKYTKEGKITVEATRRPNAQQPPNENCIAIDVTDTGPGIPVAKKDLIFQEFTRLDPEAQRGAGVGLAISRRIARILGGNITVQSEVDRGSTFTLWLPYKSHD